MAVLTEPIEQIQFNNYEEVMNWAVDTSKNLVRVPIKKFLNNGSLFKDDEYLGDGDYLVRFNDKGFQSYCNLLGFRHDMLKMIESPNLTSNVLNDLISQDEIKNRFLGYDFVIDTKKRIIIGIVTDSYVGYSNKSFIEDIELLFDNNELNEKLSYKKAYAVNSELTIMFLSTILHGEVRGRGGEGTDKSEIGFSFKNSMVGSSSVNINFYLYRLACSNGMMVPAASSIKRIYHSGNAESFQNRIDYSFSEIYRKLDLLQKLLVDLDSIPFIPNNIANNRHLASQVFDIIPRTKQDITTAYGLFVKYPKGASEQLKKEIQIKHDTEIIKRIPGFYGGEDSSQIFNSTWRNNATMFDFLNVFTEHAKSESIKDKLEIEEKTGALADYIHKNAKKFN